MAFCNMGGWNGVFILIERWLKRKKLSTEKNGKKKTVIAFLSAIYTLLVVNIGWVLFRAPDTKQAVRFVANMFGIIKPERVDFSILWYLDRWTVAIMVIGIIFASSLPTKLGAIITKRISSNTLMISKYISKSPITPVFIKMSA